MIHKMSHGFLKNLLERLHEFFEYVGVVKSDSERFVNEFLRTWEKYEHLKNAELSDVPDNKLVIAVNSWMSKKIFKDLMRQSLIK